MDIREPELTGIRVISTPFLIFFGRASTIFPDIITWNLVGIYTRICSVSGIIGFGILVSIAYEQLKYSISCRKQVEIKSKPIG